MERYSVLRTDVATSLWTWKHLAYILLWLSPCSKIDKPALVNIGLKYTSEPQQSYFEYIIPAPKVVCLRKIITTQKQLALMKRSFFHHLVHYVTAQTRFSGEAGD